MSAREVVHCWHCGRVHDRQPRMFHCQCKALIYPTADPNPQEATVAERQRRSERDAQPDPTPRPTGTEAQERDDQGPDLAGYPSSLMGADDPTLDRCPTCEGTSEIDGEECPTCAGTGEVTGVVSHDAPAPEAAIAAVEQPAAAAFDLNTPDGRAAYRAAQKRGEIPQALEDQTVDTLTGETPGETPKPRRGRRTRAEIDAADRAKIAETPEPRTAAEAASGPRQGTVAPRGTVDGDHVPRTYMGHPVEVDTIVVTGGARIELAEAEQLLRAGADGEAREHHVTVHGAGVASVFRIRKRKAREDELGGPRDDGEGRVSYAEHQVTYHGKTVTITPSDG